ncbi:MAG: hypothetical protein ACLTQL_05695 [Eisenbergiella sp.]
MLPVRKLNPGDKIIVRETWSQKDDNEKTAPRRKVTVIKQYPHHVMVVNSKGSRFCVTNAEIYQMEAGRLDKQECAEMHDSNGNVIAVKESKRWFPALNFGKEKK